MTPAGSTALEVQGAVRWPNWSLAHLRRLTDTTGIVEHALGAVPNPLEGYTLDDNARALVVAIRYHRHARDPEALELAIRYLSFILYCQMEDGWFHNDVGYDRRFLDERASEDPVGRAIWALGETAGLAELEALWVAAVHTLRRSLQWARRFSGLRPAAFSLLGLRALGRAPRDRLAGLMKAAELRQLAAELGERLLSAYHQARRPGWQWFEDRLTYCNARLPHGLLFAGELTGHSRFFKVASDTFDFLWGQLWDGQCLQVVGNRGWWERGLDRALYDQQPVDAGAMAELACAFYLATGRPDYLERASMSVEWFYGRNASGVASHDEATGGCRDGLGADGVNINQGAESTLAHLLARMAVEDALRHAAAGRKSSAMA
ncbi:MAG: hypothetical protein AB1609_05975 [Bacillota bacterium]